MRKGPLHVYNYNMECLLGISPMPSGEQSVLLLGVLLNAPKSLSEPPSEVMIFSNGAICDYAGLGRLGEGEVYGMARLVRFIRGSTSCTDVRAC